MMRKARKRFWFEVYGVLYWFEWKLTLARYWAQKKRIEASFL
jgi:hypothetical protein